MDTFTASDAASGLQALSEAAIDRREALNQYPGDTVLLNSDEETDSMCPIMGAFTEKEGSEGLLKMTNFNIREYEKLYTRFEAHISANWNVGRGNKSKYKQKDVLFMVLSVLKHGGQWDFLGRIFRIKGSTFERLIIGFINLIWEAMYNDIVLKHMEQYKMDNLIKMNRVFKNFKHARYATDATFQQSNGPSGNMQEGKVYYSGKHKLYGYKVEVSVLPTCFAIMCSNHYPGSKSDLSIMYDFEENHKILLEKKSMEINIADTGNLVDEYSDSWALLADKGYQGCTYFVHAVLPKKKPPNILVSMDDEAYNRKVSSDRIIVENYFGRMGGLCSVMSSKYRWNENNYDKMFKLCAALTNVHVMAHPLRVEDREAYNRFKNRQLTIGNETVRKRSLAQRKYRAKRRRRTEAQFYPITTRQTVDEIDLVD